MFSDMFATNSAAGNGPSGGAVPEQPRPPADQRPDADQVFGDVFEDVRHPPTYFPPSNEDGSTPPPLFFFVSRYCIPLSFYGRRSSGISRYGHG